MPDNEVPAPPLETPVIHTTHGYGSGDLARWADRDAELKHKREQAAQMTAESQAQGVNTRYVVNEANLEIERR